jgi:hypothetical protein
MLSAGSSPQSSRLQFQALQCCDETKCTDAINITIAKNMPEILVTSGEKQIPAFAMKGKREDISHMLSSLFEGDGYASIKKRTIRNRNRN